jgi:hypothetical protein
MLSHSQGATSRRNDGTKFSLANSMPAFTDIEQPTGNAPRPCDDMPHFADQPGL